MIKLYCLLDTVIPCIIFSSVLLLAVACEKPFSEREVFGLVIHGGAGTIKKEDMTAEKEAPTRRNSPGH